MPYTEYLYHFTDNRNIKNINKIGLYSFAALKAKFNYHEDKDFFPSSNEKSRNIDFNKGLGNYIRLCPDQNPPMLNIVKSENRIKDVSWLRVSFKDVVFSNLEVKFSNINAASTEANVNTNYKTFTESYDTQREVLVRFHIPIEKIVILD